MNTNENLKLVVINLINEKLTDVISDTSETEFIDEVIDKYYDSTKTELELDPDEIRTMVGGLIVPLYVKLSEYVNEQSPI